MAFGSKISNDSQTFEVNGMTFKVNRLSNELRRELQKLNIDNQSVPKLLDTKRAFTVDKLINSVENMTWGMFQQYFVHNTTHFGSKTFDVDGDKVEIHRATQEEMIEYHGSTVQYEKKPLTEKEIAAKELEYKKLTIKEREEKEAEERIEEEKRQAALALIAYRKKATTALGSLLKTKTAKVVYKGKVKAMNESIRQEIMSDDTWESAIVDPIWIMALTYDEFKKPSDDINADDVIAFNASFREILKESTPNYGQKDGDVLDLIYKFAIEDSNYREQLIQEDIKAGKP